MDKLPTLPELRKLQPSRQRFDFKGKTLGERLADAVAENMGSWRFIIIQSVILILWIVINIIGWIKEWDPYPFILLNLALSFQAAFTAPILMMSQNRQAAIDRRKAESDYHINVKAEMEIELLHEKIDALKEQEIKMLIEVIRDLEKKCPTRNNYAMYFGKNASFASRRSATFTFSLPSTSASPFTVPSFVNGTPTAFAISSRRCHLALATEIT